ncbi:MAG: hypothetical protein KAG53_00010 [Endozoicomonadaceae bacterium]|nr:hypothetical protein [Endozoicomonadaceae bacterium]
MEILRKCPCCQSEAEFVDIPVSNSLLWQVSCRHCGLSSELDNDRIVCLRQWNRREREDHLKVKLFFVTTGGALLSVIGFVLGIALGFNGGFS